MKYIARAVIPILIAGSITVGCSPKKTSEESMRSAPIEQRLEDRTKVAILSHVKESSDEKTYAAVSAGYDSLVVKVESYADVSDPNNDRFRKIIEGYLALTPPNGSRYFIIDSHDPNMRRINQVLTIDSAGAYVSSMNIPNPPR